MSEEITATDERFLATFENFSLPHEQWNHRAHLKVAYLYLRRFGKSGAERKIRDGIRAYNDAQGIVATATSGYHETMTMAWLQVVHTMLAEYGAAASADEFIDAQPQLQQKQLMRLFYSRERFMSEEARARFIEPDLATLPVPR